MDDFFVAAGEVEGFDLALVALADGALLAGERIGARDGGGEVSEVVEGDEVVGRVGEGFGIG